MSTPKGYEVYRGPSQLTGAPIRAIATLGSENAKTGNMAQIWFLTETQSPTQAIHSGADDAICGTCPLRGAVENGRNKDRVCYVKVFQAPRSVWESAGRGNYPAADTSAVMDTIGDRPVRLGAYGDPAAVPLELIEGITARASRWTGYTHAWRTRPDLAGHVMASADSSADRAAAKALGFRTFRTRTADQPIEAGEITCPASDEAGKRTTCAQCGLCNGARENDRRKDIVILVHGSGAGKKH